MPYVYYCQIVSKHNNKEHNANNINIKTMKKLRSIILIILIPMAISAQNFMTIGEVFDFEVGDEFQIEGRGLYQPPNADRIYIIDKYYSLDSNSVFYVRFHDSYYVYVENNEAYYHFWTETDTVSYTNLDLPINESNLWVPYDTSMFSYDTINACSIDYCDSLVNGYLYSVNDFEPIYYSSLYGKGLGLVRDFYNQPAEFSMYDNVLFYYKKNGISCGISDTTTVSISENNIMNDFKVYPIPASTYIIIENEKNIEVESISISNLNGHLKKCFDLNATQLYISDLVPGMYFLNISTMKGELREKIIIE